MTQREPAKKRTGGHGLVRLGGVLAVLGVCLTGCQTVQQTLAFTESRRDLRLARLLGERAELEEQYWQCRIEHGPASSTACAEYKHKLDQPLPAGPE